MKTTMKTIAILMVLLATFAFTKPIQKKQINAQESTIVWTGKKVLGSHTGTINIMQGFLEMDGERLVGGKILVDMNSIKVTDLKGGGKVKLEGHLKSPDFFGVKKYPTAVLTITQSNRTANGSYNVEGNITIKGISKNINFNLNMGENNEATTKLSIDRTQFDIKYGSGSFFDDLGDNTISNKFDLEVTLKF